MPAPLAIAGVVGVGGAISADCIGMRPTLPPKAPVGTGAATGELVVPGTITVLLSELAEPGRAARVEDDAALEVSEMGAPTMGTLEESTLEDDDV